MKSDRGEWANLGGWIEHRGAKFHLPEDAILLWPTLPHNPYRKDGHAEKEEGRISIRLPLTKESPSRKIRIELVSDKRK